MTVRCIMGRDQDYDDRQVSLGFMCGCDVHYDGWLIRFTSDEPGGGRFLIRLE